MFKLMAQYDMEPEVMTEWLAELPNFLETIRSLPTKMTIDNMWVSKDRKQFFFVRTLESEEANRRAVEETKSTPWFRETCGPLFAKQVHTAWELEPVMPVVG